MCELFFDPELTVSHTSVLTILAITVERYYAVKIMNLVSFHLKILHNICKDNVNICKENVNIKISRYYVNIFLSLCNYSFTGLPPLACWQDMDKGKGGIGNFILNIPRIANAVQCHN